MSDGEIQIDAGTAGIYVDTSLVSTGAGASVNRQRIAIGDAVQGENFWTIGSDGAGSVHVINPATVVSASVNVSVASVTVASVSVLNYPSVQVVSGSVSVLNQGGAGSNVNVTNAFIPVTQQGSWGASVSNFPAIQAVSGSVSVLDFPATQTVAGSVSVSGQVNVGNFPTNQVVSGSVSVLGGTINQGNAPWSVDAIQQGNWGASVSNFPATQIVAGSVSVLGGTVIANQGGALWTVNASQSGNWGASITNTPLAVTESGTWTVGSYQVGNYGASISNLPANQTISGSVQLLPSSADVGYVGTWATGSPIAGQTSSSVKAVPLTTNSFPSTNGILVQGLSTNIASVFVGASTVASVGVTGGFEIQAGQAVPQTAANANLVYIIGPNSTDGVCWTVL